MVIANNNVGIQSTDPWSKLEIQAGAGFDGSGDQKPLAFSWGGGGYRHWMRTRHNASLDMGFGNAIDFYLNASNVPDGSAGPESGTVHALTLDSGRVGIGTTTPHAKLDVVGDVAYSGLQNKLDVADTFTATVRCADFTIGHPSRRGSPGRALVDWGDTLVVNFDSDWANTAIWGNVGIGTTSPQAKLDVAGQVRCTTLLLTSDRNAKADFVSVDGREILEKVARLPLSTWHYTNAPGVRHLGPMAQDFRAAFNLGEDDKHIATVDADGVALASIQALYEMVQEKDSEIASLKRELASVKSDVANRLAKLEKAVSHDVVPASFRAAR
jgi:hypothetical protein